MVFHEVIPFFVYCSKSPVRQFPPNPLGMLKDSLRRTEEFRTSSVAMQSLDIYFLSMPDETATKSMDKWLTSIARKKEMTDEGLRLWLTHVPDTISRPFLDARAFDIVTLPMRMGAAKREEYQVTLGAAPKKHMVCRTAYDDEASFDVLLTIALELMKRSGQVFLALSPELAAKLLGPGKFGEIFDQAMLEQFPGAAYEVAHEDDDGMLDLEWFVDAGWLRAWKMFKNKPNARGMETFSRFASLDYI